MTIRCPHCENRLSVGLFDRKAMEYGSWMIVLCPNCYEMVFMQHNDVAAVDLSEFTRKDKLMLPVPRYLIDAEIESAERSLIYAAR